MTSSSISWLRWPATWPRRSSTAAGWSCCARLARHRTLIATLHDAVIALDARGRLLEFNPAAELMFGDRSEQVVSQDFAELLLEPHDRDIHRRELELAFEQHNGRPAHRRIEVTAVCADGRRLPVSCR